MDLRVSPHETAVDPSRLHRPNKRRSVIRILPNPGSKNIEVVPPDERDPLAGGRVDQKASALAQHTLEADVREPGDREERLVDIRDLKGELLRDPATLGHEQAPPLAQVGDRLSVRHLVPNTLDALGRGEDADVMAHVPGHDRLARPGVHRDLDLGPL